MRLQRFQDYLEKLETLVQKLGEEVEVSAETSINFSGNQISLFFLSPVISKTKEKISSFKIKSFSFSFIANARLWWSDLQVLMRLTVYSLAV